MKKYKLDITFINANGLKETQRCIDVVCFDYMTVINTLVIYQSKKSWYKQLPDYIFYRHSTIWNVQGVISDGKEKV